MLLTVNIGNSNIRFGLFNNKYNDTKCMVSWIIKKIHYRSLYGYISLFKNAYKKHNISNDLINEIVIGSVVPSLTEKIKKSLKFIHNINPLIVNRYSTSSIKHSSHELGTDLYANAVAANKLYKKHTFILIIDFGTAISLTCINNKYRKFNGIIIVPGVKISLKALIKNTFQSLKIKLKKPKNLFGKDTKTCIQSGIIYGYLSMIEGLIDRININLKKKCLVIATGGLSHIYTPLTKKIDIEDKLHTIIGLKILHFFNKKKY